jgi:hypothetical protein
MERPGKKTPVTSFATKWPDKNHGEEPFFQQPFALRLMDSMALATRTPDRLSLHNGKMHFAARELGL